MNRKIITKTLIFLLAVFLLTGGYFGYQLFKLKSTKNQQSPNFQSSIDESYTVNPSVYLDAVPFELIFKHKKNEQESYTKILLKNAKQTIVLHQFDEYNPCLENQAFVSEDLTNQTVGKKRFLINDQCGDYTKRHLITINYFNKQDSTEPLIEGVNLDHQLLDLGDIYTKKFFRVIGWADQDNLMVKEITYQDTYQAIQATNYYLVNVDDPSQKTLLK